MDVSNMVAQLKELLGEQGYGEFIAGEAAELHGHSNYDIFLECGNCENERELAELDEEEETV
jgi:hypothetical protein